MRKLILIPDSFKGTLSASAVCDIMARAARAVFPDAQVVAIPVADGGEGSVDCFLAALGGQKIHTTVQGVFGRPMEGFFGLLADGETAVIEMASCAGLPLAEGRLNPLETTTYGVGQLLLAAARAGARHIILGLGGSATNDGGCAMAAACGVRFLDAGGRTFVPVGGTLMDIHNIDLSGLDPALAGVEITAMCDIDNPLFGPNGAAHVFGPQKGADPATVDVLDAGLKHLAQVCSRSLGRDMASLPGGGAAGGMGAGAYAFLGARLRMGIEAVLDAVGFDRHLEGADLVFTGEGRIDSQSMGGKVVIGVARRAARRGVPVVAVVGAMGPGWQEAYGQGVTAVFSINTQPMAFEQARGLSEGNLAATMENILRYTAAIGEGRPRG